MGPFAGRRRPALPPRGDRRHVRTGPPASGGTPSAKCRRASYGTALGHPFVDVEKCEQKLREVAERAYRPWDPTKLLETLMRSAEAWRLFPGEQAPPLL